MKKYNEKDFCNNIINKYNALSLKKLSKSKSYSKINSNNLLIKKNIDNLKLNVPKRIKQEKFKKLRNFSSKNNILLLCLKKPYKSLFIQKILDEIIPKNIRRPYGIKKNNEKLPRIYSKTEANVKKEKIKKSNKIIIKNINFLNKKIENVTNKYIKNNHKFISNFLSPFNQFISNDFNLTNKEYYKLVENIDDFNYNI